MRVLLKCCAARCPAARTPYDGNALNPWFARNLVYRPATFLRGEPVFKILERYERTQWLSAGEIRSTQEAGLREILRYAASHSEHYRRLIRESGLAPDRLEATDLMRLPVLTKAQLVSDAESISVPRLPGTYSWKTTGGSTGIPVRIRKTRYATAAEQAASWRSYGWYGVRPGDRQARFWGTPLSGKTRARARAIDWVLNRDRFSAFAFSRDDLRIYLQRLLASRPVWVYGYVSMLVEFARFSLSEKFDLRPLGIRAVVTTSESLTEPDRRIIEEAFAAPVFNEYGCGEVGAILYECTAKKLHLMAENLFLELVPAPTEDQPDAHRILVTDLHNRATPLIRYDISDRVVPSPPCDCGRGLPAFRSIFGRAYDFITCSDGTRYHGEFFLYHLEEARDQGSPILQAQFVQTGSDRILIRVVATDLYDTRHGRDLASKIRRASNDRFEMEVEVVPGLSRERSGKIRLIVAKPSKDSEPQGLQLVRGGVRIHSTNERDR